MENEDTHTREFKLVSVKEALQCLPISRECLYRAVERNLIPHYRLGRKVMLNLSEVLEGLRINKKVE